MAQGICQRGADQICSSRRSVLDNTLIMFFSDNVIVLPFPEERALIGHNRLSDIAADDG